MIIADKIIGFLPPTEPFSVLDVGSLGGGEALRWAFMGDRLVVDGFDPNNVDCERLNKQATEAGRTCYYPVCLGRKQEKLTLHITNFPDSSSLYRPAARIARWKQCVDGINLFCTSQTVGLSRTVEVDTISLDEWSRDSGTTDADFIKLDVQGAELDVLLGGEKILEHVLGVESEVEFVPLYDGQPLFADVDAFLRAHGFMFFAFHFSHEGTHAGRMASPISVMQAASPPLRARSAGQLTSSDAFYMRDPLDPSWPQGKVMPFSKYLKLIIIAEFFGQVEFAFELLAALRDGKAPVGKSENVNDYRAIIREAAESYMKGC
jgi:FkbM family methyltransferase